MTKVNLKRSMFIIFIVIICMFTTACSYSGNHHHRETEFELVSCYVDKKIVTTRKPMGKEKHFYIHYGFKDGENIVYKEKRLLSTYKYSNYRLEFELTEGKEKIIQTYTSDQVVLTFKLKKDTYNSIMLIVKKL